MHTQHILHTRRTLASAALMLATFASGALMTHAQTLTGDYRVIPDGSEPGNLDADGDLGWGRTPGSPGAVAGKLRYFESPAQLAFDATEADAIFTWNDDATDTLRDFKMKLDANNVLSLYKTDGSAASISLTPDTGAIKLAGTGAGLFNGSGGGVLQIDGSGRPYFASKPIFQDGVDFGSGGTLDSAKVQYLQTILTNLGYDPNESSYTDVTSMLNGPTISLTRAVYANGYIHWVGSIWGDVKIGASTYNYLDGRTVVVKTNTAGTVSWVKQIKSTVDTTTFYPVSIAVNSSGTVVLGGSFSGSTSNLGAQNVTATSGMDGFVLVLNSSGTPQWSKVISSSSAFREDVYAVAIDASGNVAAAGQTEATSINFGTGSLTSAGGYSDGFVARYNSSGTATWAMLAGGSSFDTIRNVAFAPSGNVILGGYGGTTTNLGAYNVTSVGGQDCWVAALNSAGAIQWTKGIGGTSTDETRSLAVDASNNVYLLANFVGSITNLGAHNKASAGAIDGLAVMLNSSGTVQWARAIGSTVNDNMQNIAVDSSGAILVSGSIGGSTTNLGAYNITGKGESDGFTLTLDSSGAPTASQAIGGMGGDGLITAVPLGSLSSGMMVAGSVAVNATIGDTRIPSGPFLISVPSSNINTRPYSTTTTGLDWNGGIATGTEGLAIGSRAFSQGLGAVAFGSSSSIGAWSIASGSGRAYGDYSTAFGKDVTATGSYATALGANSYATGLSSFAVGSASNATGANSVAMGDGAQATAERAFAVGWAARASSDGAIALGEFSEATSIGAVAVGPYNVASGQYSTSLGVGNYALGDYSFATGLTTVTNSYASTAVGTLNIGGGNGTTWVETDPLFEIGNSTTSTRSNAHTTLKNGRTTLTNKAWKTAYTADPEDALEDPAATDDSGGDALIVEGHTRLKGKVVIEEEQGDISMGIYE